MCYDNQAIKMKIREMVSKAIAEYPVEKAFVIATDKLEYYIELQNSKLEAMYEIQEILDETTILLEINIMTEGKSDKTKRLEKSILNDRYKLECMSCELAGMCMNIERTKMNMGL